MSSGAHCDLLEARRGGSAERVAALGTLEGRHPALENLPLLHSFPSGHVAAAIAIYSSLALVLAARVRHSGWRYAAYALGVFLPVFVAGCRMYRGMHNATDALAGVLVGCLAVAIAIFVARVVGVVVSARERAKEARA